MDNEQKKDIQKRCSECPKAQPECDTCEGCHQICGGGCKPVDVRSKLHSYNWLEDVPGSFNDFDIVLRILARVSIAIARTCHSLWAIWWLWRLIPATI